MSKKKVITIAVSVVLVAAVATLIVTNVAGCILPWPRHVSLFSSPPATYKIVLSAYSHPSLFVLTLFPASHNFKRER